MSDQKLILNKLDKMEQKVDKIESAIATIAVQNERINNVSTQIHGLWNKYDAAFNADGTVPKIQNTQSKHKEKLLFHDRLFWIVLIGLFGILTKIFLSSLII